MLVLLITLVLFFLIVFFYIRQPKFGKNPAGDRLSRIRQSPNFRDGKFQNQHLTPQLAEGYSIPGIIYTQFFKKSPRRRPTGLIPSVHTNLHDLPADKNWLVWFGHSSYFMQIDDRKFLVDPVFSGNASPIPGTNKAFKGADVYGVKDMPDIDYLLITHDHYDHLDYKTIIALRSRVQRVICGLGVGAHLESWGYRPEQVIEMDWYESINPEGSFTLIACPARHFSGRNFGVKKTLWESFVLQTPSLKIYIGGDSGYDSHFADIGERYGPFDLAILDNGQYNLAWRYIHMHPQEVLQAAKDLKARCLFPVHSGKFEMANHAWDEPLQRITVLNKDYGFPLLTPVIGEPVMLGAAGQEFRQWWQGLS